jgi:hypothetical protein
MTTDRTPLQPFFLFFFLYRAPPRTLCIAAREWTKLVPVDSTVAYLNSEVLYIPLPQYPSWRSTNGEVVWKRVPSFTFINAYNSKISLTNVYRISIFRPEWQYHFEL